ncbi:common pilus major fimbrillin subunit EcpA [Yersinia massiliensis]|uniref:common pilus major fimbrillin subunit EcpA n=1 Tax=Yersinia massiliensis TaxID=419257 RepID=UPI0006AD0635|nr:common pilus major fimbrillin subunit EcpA [Yersinia massiliensis]MCB5309648.1 common pilus major fimbrillin subunit EcpA [Yersinia massiliensis]
MKNASMKKNTVVALAVMSIFAAANVAHAAIHQETATATWTANASKTTTAKLAVDVDSTVDPEFIYNNTDGFGTVDAPFKLTVSGEGSATAFTLAAKTTGSNTLHAAVGTSTLNVGVMSGTTTLLAAADTIIFDAATPGSYNPDFDPLSTSYNDNVDRDVNSKFTLKVINSTNDSGANVAPFAMPNTTWSGDVKVVFTANWTVPV